jgi:hypothetical protein
MEPPWGEHATLAEFGSRAATLSLSCWENEMMLDTERVPLSSRLCLLTTTVRTVTLETPRDEWNAIHFLAGLPPTSPTSGRARRGTLQHLPFHCELWKSAGDGFRPTPGYASVTRSYCLAIVLVREVSEALLNAGGPTCGRPLRVLPKPSALSRLETMASSRCQCRAVWRLPRY